MKWEDMLREAGGRLVKLVKRVTDRLDLPWRAKRGEAARDGAARDPLAAYAAPSHRSKEPPYASLRQ